MSNLTQSFGNYVRYVRMSRGETLEDVAREAGLTKGLISRIENGKGNPCLSTMSALGRALKLKVSFGKLGC